MESLQKISERLDAVRPWRRVDCAPKGNVVRFRAGKNDKHNVNFPCSLIVPLPDYSMFLDVLVKDYEQYRVANSWVEIPDKCINKLVVDIDKCESETERDKNIAVVEDIIINMIKSEKFLKPTTDDQVPSILVATRGLNAHIYSNLAITRRDLQEFADAVRPYDRIDDRVATGGSGMRFFFSQKEVSATGDLLPDALYKPACFKQLSMDDGKLALQYSCFDIWKKYPSWTDQQMRGGRDGAARRRLQRLRKKDLGLTLKTASVTSINKYTGANAMTMFAYLSYIPTVPRQQALFVDECAFVERGACLCMLSRTVPYAWLPSHAWRTSYFAPRHQVCSTKSSPIVPGVPTLGDIAATDERQARLEAEKLELTKEEKLDIGMNTTSLLVYRPRIALVKAVPLQAASVADQGHKAKHGQSAVQLLSALVEAPASAGLYHFHAWLLGESVEATAVLLSDLSSVDHVLCAINIVKLGPCVGDQFLSQNSGSGGPCAGDPCPDTGCGVTLVAQIGLDLMLGCKRCGTLVKTCSENKTCSDDLQFPCILCFVLKVALRVTRNPCTLFSTMRCWKSNVLPACGYTVFPREEKGERGNFFEVKKDSVAARRETLLFQQRIVVNGY
eukprot:g62581.t1